MTILGISIGTTRTGVCVLRDGVLLDRSVHNYYDAWSETKLRVILNRYKRYIVKRKVQAIVVKIPPPRKHTKAITHLLRRVDALAKKHRCSFDLITKKEITHTLKLRTTTALNEYARLLYPELTFYHEKGAGNGHKYYKKVFEAVLSAHIFESRQRARGS